MSTAAIADGYEPVGKVYVPPPVFNWTGAYGGFSLGWIRSESETQLTSTGSFIDSGADALLPRTLGHSTNGFLAGLTLGYNQKLSSTFVGGIESDISYVDANASQGTVVTGVIPMTATPVTASETISTDMKWFGTLRARAGWLASREFLIYATGGLAYANLEHGATASLVGGPYDFAVSGASSDWKVGWTIGGGFEWVWSNKTTLKTEYLYYDLNDSSVTVVDPSAPGGTLKRDIDNTGHIVRAGLNVGLY